MKVVMDASALIAYLKDEEGSDVVDELLMDPGNSCLAHAINMCEVYYDFLLRADESTAEAAVLSLAGAGVAIREDASTDLWQQAGRIKARFRRVSLADCFCLALGKLENADVVSSDHHEFDAIAERGVCGIRFIR